MRPVYERWTGWNTDTSGCRAFDDLPDSARRYLARIEEVCATPIRLVGVGAARLETITLSTGAAA